MADVKFEVVRFALSTAAAGNTQDVTISGFGTPKAAIFIVTNAAADGVIAAHSRFSYGFTDGTREAACSFLAVDNTGTSNTRRGHHTDRVIVLETSSSSEWAGLSFDSWITDGIRLSIDTASTSGFLCTCILVGGSDVSNAYVGTHDDLGTGTSAVDITAPGFNPDLVNIVGIGQATTPPIHSSHAIFGVGMGINDGLDTQRYSGIGSVFSSSSAAGTGYVGNDSITGQTHNGSLSWDGVIGGYGASGFSITPNSSAGNDIISYLALKFSGSPDIALFDVEWPTSGNYAETGLSFTPDFGMISSIVGVGSRNVADGTGVFGLSIAAFDDSNIYTANATDKDGVDPMVSKSLHASSLRILDSGGVADSVAASSYTMEADGWDFSLSTNPASSVLGWGLAIRGGGGGSTTVSPGDITQSQTIDNVTLTQSSVMAVSDISQSQLIDNVPLNQNSIVAVDDVGQTQLLGVALITQHGVLVVNDTEQGQSLDNVVLTQAHVIAVADISQSQSIDGVTLTSAGTLSIDDLTQAQLIDPVSLVQAGILVADDLAQANSLDSVVLTVAGSLAVNAITQGQFIDDVTLSQAGTLTVAGIAQSQSIDVVSLVQHYQLAVQALLQGQLLDSATLVASGAGLSVDAISQSQTIDQAQITEHAVLSVADLTQSQIIDIVSFGGLVIGELRGEIVMYALIDGKIDVKPLLTGNVATLH